MLRPRWKKVLRDLWVSKTRTLLVVLSIAVGVFAFGAIATTRTIVGKELKASYLSINPASAIITTDLFDDDLVDVVRTMEGVGEADGQRSVAARIQIGTNEWYDIKLFVIPDDGDMRVNIVRPESGIWPPPKHAILIERASLAKTRANVGDVVVIEMPDSEQRAMPIVGLAHDLNLPPAPISGKAFGYISFDTLEWLGQPRGYDKMQIVVADHPLSEDHIWHEADRVADKIERSGREVYVTDVPTPQQHPAEMVIPTLMLILGSLGVMAMLLGLFLIVNTIEAILTQQVKQIGMMKAVGARNGQIIGLYIGMVVIFGLLALGLSVPLGTLGSLVFSGFIAQQINFDLVHFRVPVEVVVLEAFAALLLPILATLPIIRSAVGITVREALSYDGANLTHTSSGLIDRIVQRIRGVPRPLLLSLRNTFRRKGRLLRTLVVLALAGAIFISVLTVRASLFRMLDVSMESKLYDVEVRFSRPYRSAKIEPEALRIPGVVGVESWGFTAEAYPVRPDGSEGENINLYAPPADTAMLKLQIEQGRWLRPDDDRAIVVSSNFLTLKEPGTHVGDTIVLKIDGEEYSWQIVGTSREFMPPVNPAIGYVNYETYARLVGDTGRVDNLQVATAQHDAAFQKQVTQALDRLTAASNFKVRLIRSTSEDRAILNERFNILTAALSIMATLIATVGAIGLTGTMSINVIERSKEIGIMRAIGASNGAIRQIVMVESILIGVISWFIGTLVSVPISRLMSNQLGIRLVGEPLIYSYAFYAVFIWLGLVVILSSVASLLPARNALRITVREVLAYE